MTVAEQIARAKNDYDEVYKAGKLAVLGESEYMHPTVSGSVVAVNDVNAIEHNLGVTLTKKNLFTTANYYQHYGVTYEILDSNSVKETAVAGGSTAKYVNFKFNVPKNTDFTLSGVLTTEGLSNSSTKAPYVFGVKNGALSTAISTYKIGALEYTDYKFATTFNTGDFETIAILLYLSIQNTTADGAAATWSNLQLEEGTTATEFLPYTDKEYSTVTVSRYGKNLFDKDIASNRSNWASVNGGYYNLSVFVGKGNTVTVSYKQDLTPSPDSVFASVYNVFATAPPESYWLWHTTAQNYIHKTVTLTAIDDYIYFRVHLYQTDSLDRFMNYIGNDLQIEIGTTATDYESYIEPQTVTANADGTVEGLTSLSPNMTLMTDTDGVVINCQYYRDIDTYINNLMIDVATSGGE